MSLKTHFRPEKIIQPFYTGGKVALDQSGRILVTTLDEDVLITNFETGEELARLEGVGLPLIFHIELMAELNKIIGYRACHYASL